MTDIQVVGGLKKATTKAKAKTKKRVGKQPDEAHYDEADITEGKAIAARLKSQDEAVVVTELELGQLADRVQTKYRKKTLADFAEKIGVKAARLNRCRSVYRGYKDKNFKGAPPKFAVLQALQGHPRRYEILEQYPKLTMREARTAMRDYRAGQGIPEPEGGQAQEPAPEQEQTQEEPAQAPQAQEVEEPTPAPEQAQAPASPPDPSSAPAPVVQEETPQEETPPAETPPAETPPPAPAQPQEDWRVRDARACYNKALKLAAEARDYAYVREEYLVPEVLRKSIDNLEQLLDALGKGGEALLGLRDKVKRALASPTPPPSEAAPGDPTSD
jgi:hypothetical protein